MALMTPDEVRLARAVSTLTYANPFLPERLEAEQAALGDEFKARGTVWHAEPAPFDDNENLRAINRRVEELAERLRERLAGSGRARNEEVTLYEDLVLYLLYNRYLGELQRLIAERDAATARVAFAQRFAGDVERYLGGGRSTPDPARLLALFFQVRRAFFFTFTNIIGTSLPAARLRAAAWQAIFTHDGRRYRRSLYRRMQDVTTLIVGPSGSGKELVARAIGYSRYIPLDAAGQRFTEDFRASFYALSLSAMPGTLVESELFGHRRGAFTGAVADRPGFLEVCPPLGTVFLDEIAEVDPAVQVKLLRVLQSRTFHRIGDTQERRFEGKILAATNRDLEAEMRAGRFREDLYYRLCSDIIHTPSLADQLRGTPDELAHLLRFVAARVAGEDEAEQLAGEAHQWITKHLGRDYAWPGNVRELEQCVRNIMVRGEYRPTRPREATPSEDLAAALEAGALTADEVLRRYCSLVFARTGSYQETARRLGMDRRTVKDKVDPGRPASRATADDRDRA
jgi:hypothetical protein